MDKGKLLPLLLVFGLLSVSCAHAAGARSLHQTKVLDAAENVLQGATSAVRNGLKTLVTDLFGPENSFFTQIPQEIKSLSWNNLKNLDVETPVENFLNSIRNLNLPSAVLSATDKVTDLLEEFCEEPDYEPSEKIPSNCVGKSIVVRLAPWKCALYKNLTVGCSPPFIEVLTAPAVCSAKYESAATYTGKECKLVKKIGENFTRTVGGTAFAINLSKNILDIPHELSTSLLTDSASAISGLVSKVTATAGR